MPLENGNPWIRWYQHCCLEARLYDQPSGGTATTLDASSTFWTGVPRCSTIFQFGWLFWKIFKRFHMHEIQETCRHISTLNPETWTKYFNLYFNPFFFPLNFGICPSVAGLHQVWVLAPCRRSWRTRSSKARKTRNFRCFTEVKGLDMMFELPFLQMETTYNFFLAFEWLWSLLEFFFNFWNLAIW